MKKLRKRLKNNPKIYFLLYKLYLPIKRLKNRKYYDRHYTTFLNDLNTSFNQKKIIYVGIPIHSNLGDLAQYYCIKKWLEVYYPERQIIEVSDNIICHNHKNIVKKMKSFISSDDFFVFQSGYRTTDVANFEGEYAHQQILKSFKNRILVFPQTVSFKYNKEIIKSSAAYKRNNNYLFLARDEISYSFARQMYDERKVLLYPDIVTSLIGNVDFVDFNKNRNGILFCLRNDEEKLYSDEKYKQLINKLKDITKTIDRTDTSSSSNFEFNKSSVEKELISKLNQFANYKLIITDRYHGTIFSLISNTPVIVLNSTDHKLSSGVRWFQGVYDDFVYYCNDLDDVFKVAKKIYTRENNEYLSSYFNDCYYACLYDRFNESMKKDEFELKEK